jgi:hypothetical protein
VHWLAAGLDPANVELRLNTIVKRIRWQPGEVESTRPHRRVGPLPP